LDEPQSHADQDKRATKKNPKKIKMTFCHPDIPKSKKQFGRPTAAFGSKKKTHKKSETPFKKNKKLHLKTAKNW